VQASKCEGQWSVQVGPRCVKVAHHLHADGASVGDAPRREGNSVGSAGAGFDV